MPGPREELAPHPVLSRHYKRNRDRAETVRKMFDAGAIDYEQIECLAAFGSGSWYRRRALRRAGLCAGMKVLDVAIGTGLVAREEVRIIGSSTLLVGVDPSIGMVQQAARKLSIDIVIGLAENLPFADRVFDFLSLGYALRHISDLRGAFSEFRRVLRPGGHICLLEVTRPTGGVSGLLFKHYMQHFVPALARITSRQAGSSRLWEYFWDTIATCVSPKLILAALREAGFVEVRHVQELGIFSEYVARRSH